MGDKQSQEKREGGMQASKETGEKKKGFASQQQKKCNVGKRGQEKLYHNAPLIVKYVIALL